MTVLGFQQEVQFPSFRLFSVLTLNFQGPFIFQHHGPSKQIEYKNKKVTRIQIVLIFKKNPKFKIPFWVSIINPISAIRRRQGQSGSCKIASPQELTCLCQAGNRVISYHLIRKHNYQHVTINSFYNMTI